MWDCLIMNKKIVFVACCELGEHLLFNLIKDGVKFSYIAGISKELAKKNKVCGYFSFEEIAKKNDIPYYGVKS